MIFRKLQDLIEESFVGINVTRVVVRDENIIGEIETEEITVLSPKAISNGLIDQKKLSKSIIRKGSAVGKTTLEGDIVIKLTTPYEAARVSAADAGLLVPSYCMILRDLAADIIPYYLVAFLNTNYAKHELADDVAATTNSMLRRGKVLSLQIPLLSKDEQTALGDLYYLAAQKQAVLGQIIENEKAVADSLITKAIMGVTSHDI